MEVPEFTAQYTELTVNRQGLSLVENREGACVFLEGQGCRIEPAKPAQCKAFPESWRYHDSEAVCPAIGSGVPMKSNSKQIKEDS